MLHCFKCYKRPADCSRPIYFLNSVVANPHPYHEKVFGFTRISQVVLAVAGHLGYGPLNGYILELEQPRKTAKIPQIFSDFYYE